MKAYFVSHKDVDGNKVARVYNQSFNRIDSPDIFCYAIIDKMIVGSMINRQCFGSCRYQLIDRFDFDNESDADKFIKERLCDKSTEEVTNQQKR